MFEFVSQDIKFELSFIKIYLNNNINILRGTLWFGDSMSVVYILWKALIDLHGRNHQSKWANDSRRFDVFMVITNSTISHRVCLQQKGVNSPNLCVTCKESIESNWHAFLLCCCSVICWRLVLLTCCKLSWLLYYTLRNLA